MAQPENAKRAFYLAQLVLGGGIVAILLYFRSREPKSGFRVREADQWKPEGPRFPAAGRLSGPDPRASTAKKAKAPPLQIPGIRIDGQPHEILGVQSNASAKEVQRAYRDLIKRFHPDIVGRPGSREWADAQRIAEALNYAKDEMLRALGAKKT